MHLVTAQNLFDFLGFIYHDWLIRQKVLETEWLMEGAPGWISTRIPPNPKLLMRSFVRVLCVSQRSCKLCPRVPHPSSVYPMSPVVLSSLTFIPSVKMHLKCCWGSGTLRLRSWILTFWQPHLSALFSVLTYIEWIYQKSFNSWFQILHITQESVCFGVFLFACFS